MAELSPLPRPLFSNPSVSAKKGVSCGVGLVHVGNSSSGEGWDPLKGALCLEPYLSPPELTPQKGHLLRSTENASPDSERCLGGTSPSKNKTKKNVSTFSEPCVAKRVCVWRKLQQNTDMVIFLAIFFRFKRISCSLYRGVISCRSFYLTR